MTEATKGLWILDDRKSNGPTMLLWREVDGETETRRVKWDDAARAPALREALAAMVSAYGNIPPEELDHPQTAALAAARAALKDA